MKNNDRKQLTDWIAILFVPFYLALSSFAIFASRSGFERSQRFFPSDSHFLNFVMTSSFLALGIEVSLLFVVALGLLNHRRWAKLVFSSFCLYTVIYFFFNFFITGYTGIFGLPKAKLPFDFFIMLLAAFSLFVTNREMITQNVKKDSKNLLEYFSRMVIVAVGIFGMYWIIQWASSLVVVAFMR